MKQLNHFETLKKMPKHDIDCILFLCNVTSENLGLILRSSDIFGVKDVYYNGETFDLARIKKTSRQSKTKLHFVSNSNGVTLLTNLRQEGYTIVALEITDESIPIRKANMPDKICIIVGNEKIGIPNEILDAVDFAYHIEMVGGNISSMNVAIATSIAFYKIIEFCLDKNEKVGF